MSRARASSEKLTVSSSMQPRSPPALSLEEMRKRMLFRRGHNDLQMNAAALEQQPDQPNQPLFVGRSLVIANSPPHPSSTNTTADPHKLFQLLRRKKRTPVPGEVKPLAPKPLAADVAPDRREDDVTERPVIVPDEFNVAQRPTGPQRAPSETVLRPHARAFSAGTPSTSKRVQREVQSAQATASDGRPCTRQKLPTQSLDLFPKSAPPKEAGDPFPRPAARKATSTSPPKAAAKQGGKTKPTVDFNCLFVSGDDDFEGRNEEFPSPKVQVDIPLIETDWFQEGASWEAIPVPDTDVQDASQSLELESDTSASLYELLVAQKSKRSVKTSKAAAVH